MNAPLLDAPKFETGRSDPRLAECLKEFPPAIFSERLYQSIELMERYSIELARRFVRPVEPGGTAWRVAIS